MGPWQGKTASRTGAGIIFKGSGFYSTDYRSKAYQEAAKKEAPTAGEKSSSGKESKTPPPKTSTSAHRLNRRRDRQHDDNNDENSLWRVPARNEAERIYCHNCGERLDRSMAAAQKPMVDPTETHRRLQKMFGNRRAGAVTNSLL